MNGRFVLGIESALAGGSLCLIEDGRELGSWLGTSNVSRAEDLLPNIDRLLKEHSISINKLDRIIVSTGPGSFTGIKIGLATVLGFRSVLGVSCVGISVLEALASVIDEPDLTAAVPVGRGSICVQSFKHGKATSAAELRGEEDLKEIASNAGPKLLLHCSLVHIVTSERVIDAGWNMASYLCRAVDSEFASTELRPLFVERKSVNI